MPETEKMRSFIIRFFYLAIWVTLIYLFLQYALPVLTPIIMAFVIAFLLNPLINLVAKRTRLGRKSAAIILLCILYLVLGAVISLVGATVIISLSEWFTDLPSMYLTSIEPLISNTYTFLDRIIIQIDPAIYEFFESVSDSIADAGASLVTSLSTGVFDSAANVAGQVPWVVVGTVLCIIASFFFVVDYYKIIAFAAQQLPLSAKRRLLLIKDYLINVLFKFARAYIILLSITFAEVFVGLSILRINGAFPIALITAAVDILPVFGTGTIMIPWALFSLITGNIPRGIGLALLYIVVLVVRQILEPRIIGHQIGLYPLLTLICMFVGAQLFGFFGMLATPITLTVLIHLNNIGEIHIFRRAAAMPTPLQPMPSEGAAETPENTEDA